MVAAMPTGPTVNLSLSPAGDIGRGIPPTPPRKKSPLLDPQFPSSSCLHEGPQSPPRCLGSNSAISATQSHKLLTAKLFVYRSVHCSVKSFITYCKQCHIKHCCIKFWYTAHPMFFLIHINVPAWNTSKSTSIKQRFNRSYDKSRLAPQTSATPPPPGASINFRTWVFYKMVFKKMDFL